jgi:putative endonuclease
LSIIMTRATIGAAAESRAEAHLVAHGLILVARNWRCRMGEIDLIMKHGATLVFVEVRCRAHGGFGGAAASITGVKQRRIALAARHYLSALGKTPPCRFDAVLIEDGRLEWIRDAFQGSEA